MRRVLDDDAAFRARVAEAAASNNAEDELGRASWLFVCRPDGWEEEFEAVVAEAGDAAAVAEDAIAEQRAERRLHRANERIARLEADKAAATDREAVATAELAAARRARHAVAERAAEMEGQLAAEREEAARLRGELAAAQAASPPQPPPPPAPPPSPSVDVAALRRTLDAAAQAARAVAASLDDARALIPAESASAAPPESGSRRRAPESRPPRSPRPTPTAAGRRTPLPLPPGVLDDSGEAAEHLVRANGVVVLVDGYNATLSAWPDLPLAEQRRRLVDALAELVARTGADAQVVFDGTADPADSTALPRPPGAARPPVRVLFSPRDVPADDVILDLVDAIPPHRPVVVASDDRAVQDGAMMRGANVINRAQLLAVLRRSPAG